MRGLQQTPNMGSPTPENPNGQLIDKAGGIAGTALTEILYGDLMVGIHKLMDLAGIVQNNLPDNETNKYQLIQGFVENFVSEWRPSNKNVDFSNVKWVIYGQEIYYHKTSVNTNNSPNLDSTNWHRVLYWDGVRISFPDVNKTCNLGFQADGTLLFSEGDFDCTVERIATAVYRITHNLGEFNYVINGIVSGNTNAKIVTLSANTFGSSTVDVRTTDSSGNFTEGDEIRLTITYRGD